MAKSRLCENENVEVWNIDADTLSDVFTGAARILDNEYEEACYSNLVTMPVETANAIEYNGVLYVHVL